MSTTLRSSILANRSIALRYAALVGAVLALDLLTKYWAVAALSDGGVVVNTRFSLSLVFNTGAAGGVSFGPFTWLFNVAGTLAAIVLVCSVLVPLARVDDRAVRAMALIAGGAAGNLTSLLLEPRGVPDFIAVRLSRSLLVFNSADVALWAGAVLLVPIVIGLLRTIRAERAADVQSATL